MIGVLLIAMALSGTALRRLPISTTMLYLAAGFALGPAGFGLMTPGPFEHAVLLEKCTEVAVLISLFAVGLKLGLPLSSKAWRLPLRLAVVSMTITVALIAALGVFLLDLPLGAAVLLGAILAPTDPVLASDVQVQQAGDRDRLRFSLTGEGGMNDGTAFPFVMLGLGLLGLHDLGTGLWRWVVVDVLWATAGGLFIGAAMGLLIGRLVVYLRGRNKESVGLDEFLALGLVALSYGLAILCHTYGFLAVFAAGLALQRFSARPSARTTQGMERPASEDDRGREAPSPEAISPRSEYAGAFLMHEVEVFNAQLERIAEMGIVLVVGAMLYYISPPPGAVWLVPLLLLIIRPLSVWAGLLGAPLAADQRLLISWFGIRGIGSLYYLMYAINHGLPRPLAEQIAALTLTMVAVSIVLHGVSVTPLMDRYSRRTKSQKVH